MITTTVVTLAVLYLLAVGVLWLFQDRLLFPGAGTGRGVPVDDVPGVRVERLEWDGPGRVRAALAAVADPGAVLVCFGGNAQDLRSGVYEVREWTRYGHTTLFVEFPGYGDSDGRPTRASLLAAARAGAAAARRIAEREGGLPVVAVGNSLGTFSALALAAEGLVDRALLRAPPSSIADVGQQHYPLLPVRLLLRHDLDNVALAPRVGVPVLILHGDRDRIVPLRFGRRLHAALGAWSELLVAKGYGHNDLPIERGWPPGERIAEFLAEGR